MHFFSNVYLNGERISFRFKQIWAWIPTQSITTFVSWASYLIFFSFVVVVCKMKITMLPFWKLKDYMRWCTLCVQHSAWHIIRTYPFHLSPNKITSILKEKTVFIIFVTSLSYSSVLLSQKCHLHGTQ